MLWFSSVCVEVSSSWLLSPPAPCSAALPPPPCDSATPFSTRSATSPPFCSSTPPSPPSPPLPPGHKYLVPPPSLRSTNKRPIRPHQYVPEAPYIYIYSPSLFSWVSLASSAIFLSPVTMISPGRHRIIWQFSEEVRPSLLWPTLPPLCPELITAHTAWHPA